ncbi:MAG: tRNA lysidine(34) synthetase TilS [Thalassobaculaceae bacterium]
MLDNQLLSNEPNRPVGHQEFESLIANCGATINKSHLAVGVSGGADSMALCILAARWGRSNNVLVTALVVDHGLRESSSSEAVVVASWLKRLEIPFKILTIEKSKPTTGVQEKARRWRFLAFDNWCRSNGVGAVLLGHTLDDQIETLFMRIDADTGPDGLSGMLNYTRVRGLIVVRPLLSVTKKRLIATCNHHNQRWINDPSNLDERFTRVFWRNLKPKIGLKSRSIQRFSSVMGNLRSVIDHYCRDFIKCSGGVSSFGLIWFQASDFDKLPPYFSELMIGRILRSIGGASKPIKRRKIANLCRNLIDNSALTETLGGCIVQKLEKGRILIYREYAKCPAPNTCPHGITSRWDNRFEITLSGGQSVIIEALGHRGWRQVTKDKNISEHFSILKQVPFKARLSLPVVRHLDGGLSIPHFTGVNDVKVCSAACSVVAEFRPDADWIWELVA